MMGPIDDPVSTSITASTESLKTSLLHEHLMLERKNCDPMKYYTIVAILGEGSMGSVSKVKKRQDVLGGSARPWHHKQASPFAKLLKCWARCCSGDGQDHHQLHPRSALVDSIGSGIESRTSIDELSNASQSISSMIRFGKQHHASYALKSIRLAQARNVTLREELKNEVEILKTLQHPNIVRPIETFEYGHSLYLVMELCSGGDLYTRDPYSENDAARISQSILSAVAYLHEEGISHRDLKYENIMFTSDQPDADVKIIDFGLSKKYGRNANGASATTMHEAVGTVYSMSPEVLQRCYTKQADVWSCGVLTFMLLSSTMPFYGKNRKHVMKRILRGIYEFKGPRWKFVSDEAREFVARLLRYEPDERPTAAGAMGDPWFRARLLESRRFSISSLPETMDAVQASIENFATYTTLKRLALMVVAHRSTSQEIGFLRRMFRKYDDQKGYVTLAGFKRALEDYAYTEEELERLFAYMDVDGSGQVQYFEFLAATIETHGYMDEERLAEAFDRLDCDNSGYITVGNLRDFLGSEVPDAYLDKIIREADLTHDMQIDYDEFLQMWNIKCDSTRLKTLQSVTQRRFNQSHHGSDSRPSSLASSRASSFDSIDDLSGLSDSCDPGFHSERATATNTFEIRKRESLATTKAAVGL